MERRCSSAISDRPLHWHDPPLPDPGEAVTVLEAALTDPAPGAARAAAEALIGLALHGDDPALTECCCLAVGVGAPYGSPCSGRPDGAWVTPHAGSGGSAAGPRPRRGAGCPRGADPQDVDGRALDGLDEVRQYAPVRP